MKLKGRNADLFRDMVVKLIYEKGEMTSSEIFSILKDLSNKNIPKQNTIPQILVRSEFFFKAGQSIIIGEHYSVTRWGLTNIGNERYDELSN